MLWSLTKNVLIIINCKHVWSHPPVMDGIVIRKDIYPSVVRRDNWTQKFPEIFVALFLRIFLFPNSGLIKSLPGRQARKSIYSLEFVR